MRIREATVDDAAAIAAVHIRSWQRAYRGTFPDEYLDTLSLADRTAAWTRSLTGSDLTTLLIFRDERLAGFATVAASRDEDRRDGDGELFAIYLDPDDWGTGAGRELLAAAHARLRAGHREATLWVLAGNERAQRFYRAAGWHFDGTTKDDTMAGTAITEHRYRRTL